MDRLVLWPVLCVLQRFGPEGAKIHSHHLRSVDHLPKWPHEGTVYPHQLLCIHLQAEKKRAWLFWFFLSHCQGKNISFHHSLSYLVSLVKDHSDLVVLTFEGFNRFWELVRDVQFVGVKQQNDTIHPLAKPTQDLCKVITCRWTRVGRGTVILLLLSVSTLTWEYIASASQINTLWTHTQYFHHYLILIKLVL